MDIKEIFQKTNLKVKYNEPLSKYTSWQVGGFALIFIEPQTQNGLQTALKICTANKIPFFIIGAGSNLLISDQGYKGAVIKLKEEFEQITFDMNKCQCKTGASVRLPYLIKKYVDNECSGLELLSGIPGTVGGALIMNAGTKDSAISDTLVSVNVMDMNGKTTTLSKSQIKFDYRKSSLEGTAVLDAIFHIGKKTKQDIVDSITKTLINRNKTQPLATFNAGSVFKNPAGKFPDGTPYTAGRLIDETGLKGFSVGKAVVSDKHANFIINSGGATSEDICLLIEEIQKKVNNKFNVKLELEVKLI